VPEAKCRGCVHEAIKVTVSDPDTGEVLGEQIVKDDYLLICAGRRYLKSTQVEAQLAIIRTEMVTLDQVMLPYMRGDSGQTMYELYVNQQLALPSGSG
jgi:hypothetical protein